LSVVAASSGTAGAGLLPIGPPTPERRRRCFCRGSSSSDDTPSLSRTTHTYLPLPGVGTASGPASSATCREANTVTCWATAPAMTTSSVDQTASLGNDHAVRLVAPLYRSYVDVVQHGHCCQQ
jgi:hypothetical protein